MIHHMALSASALRRRRRRRRAQARDVAGLELAIHKLRDLFEDRSVGKNGADPWEAGWDRSDSIDKPGNG